MYASSFLRTKLAKEGKQPAELLPLVGKPKKVMPKGLFVVLVPYNETL
ncbi:MAG: hypothetical protein ACI96W_002405 [Paraglaciecola sp.]|jgi:hypothetical protein